MFRFSDDWSLGTFLFFVLIGLTVSFFCKIGTENKGKGNSGFFFFLAFLILFLVESLRSVNVGVDTEEYVDVFREAHLSGYQAFLIKPFEPLFMFYIYITSRITDNYIFLFACNAVIKQTAFITFVKKYWKKGDSFLFLPLFVINFQYELAAMRSALAVAFILYAFVYIDSRKYFLSILFSFIAIGFHYTAVFALAIIVFRLALLYKKDRVSIKMLVLLMMATAIVINASTIFLQGFVQENTVYGGYVDELGSGWLGYWYLVLVALMSISILSKQFKKKERFNTNDLVNLIMIGCLPVFVVLGAYRIPKYFLMCRNVTIKDYYTGLVKSQRDPQTKAILKLGGFVLLILLLLFFSGRMNSGGVYELNPMVVSFF